MTRATTGSLAGAVAEALVAFPALLVPSRLTAQASARDDVVFSSFAAWIHFDAPPRGEPRANVALRPTLPAWTVNAFGHLPRRVGQGLPRRVVACAMDVPAFVVSQITDDFYIRLHHTGTPTQVLWDQFHEAQPVRLRTAREDVPGVVAVANRHFARQHRADTAIVGVDQLA